MWLRNFRREMLALCALVLVVLYMAACGGGGGGTGPGTGGGPTGPVPTVLSASPGDGATGVGTNSDVFAIFSTDMNGSTVTSSSFTLSGGVTGTVTYDATHRAAKFHPSANLAAGTTYTATITTAVKGTGGRPLAATYAWSFTTAAGSDTVAPTVVQPTTPVDGATGVAVNTVIKIKFSEAMDPTTFPTQLEVPLDATHSVFLTVSWNATLDEVSLTPPSTGLPKGVYSIDIIGYKDAAGNPMQSFTLDFTTVP